MTNSKNAWIFVARIISNTVPLAYICCRKYLNFGANFLAVPRILKARCEFLEMAEKKDFIRSARSEFLVAAGEIKADSLWRLVKYSLIHPRS